MKLLIVDDEKNMRHMLKAMLERHGYTIYTAEHGKDALDLLREDHFDFVLCDVKMPVLDGLGLLKTAGEAISRTTVIMMSAYGTIDLAIEAMKAGAYDFISKPFKTDEVLLVLKKAEEREHLRHENEDLKNKIKEVYAQNQYGAMVGQCIEMQRLFHDIERVSKYNTTVLVTGESGTGKELVAKCIHEKSARSKKEFLAVNCGTLQQSLVESELFGYTKGAFTGADSNRKGLVEHANGSTLFLDEIGELPFNLQVKLLRVLQEQEVRPVGSVETRPVDIRVIAATARDLQAMVSEGLFRQDLYFRLNVVQLRVPSLRERKEDIPLLCRHFVKKFNSSLGKNVEFLSPEAMTMVMRHLWPGNVRELENAIQHGIVLTSTNTIEIQHLPESIVSSNSQSPSSAVAFEGMSLKDAQKEMESLLIARAMQFFSGNKSKAAKALEISYPSLLSKLKRYGLD